MIKVYHNPDTNFFQANPKDISIVLSGDGLVAEVETDDLNEAYRLTNHIDEPWWDNSGVKCYKQSRSTSVGDFMLTSKGEWYQVASVGFEKVEVSEDEQ
jgi:hypothetical protein